MADAVNISTQGGYCQNSVQIWRTSACPTRMLSIRNTMETENQAGTGADPYLPGEWPFKPGVEQDITRSSAVAVIADRTACKFAVCTPLRVHCSRHSAVSAHVSAGAANGTVPTRGPTNAVTCVLGARCASFFVLRFMAKRCIVEQKCQKGQIGTLMLGTRWYKF